MKKALGSEWLLVVLFSGTPFVEKQIVNNNIPKQKIKNISKKFDDEK